MLNEKMNTNKKGMTLIELLAVLGVGGGMVAGALLLVGNVMNERDVKQHSENISTIFNNMQSLFSDEPVTDIADAVMTETLVTAGVFPNSLKINAAGDSVRTPGGGEVVITGASGSEGYNLSYQKIKTATCVEVLKSQKRVGWDSYIVVAGDATANADGGDAFDGSSVATFATECNVAGDWVSVGFFIE